MKTTITAIAIAAVFAACTSRPNTGAETRPLANDNQESYNHNALTDKPQVIELEPVAEPAPTVVREKETIVKYVYVNSPKATAKTSTKKVPAKSTTTTRSETSTRSNQGTVAQTPVPAKKKGWSKAAKGTAIGAGSGAILGAVLSKNKGKGAIIGGVIGAAGGYVIGRAKDKKDGRYFNYQ